MENPESVQEIFLFWNLDEFIIFHGSGVVKLLVGGDGQWRGCYCHSSSRDELGVPWTFPWLLFPCCGIEGIHGLPTDDPPELHQHTERQPYFQCTDN
jgi:hypothetical protein